MTYVLNKLCIFLYTDSYFIKFYNETISFLNESEKPLSLKNVIFESSNLYFLVYCIVVLHLRVLINH